MLGSYLNRAQRIKPSCTVNYSESVRPGARMWRHQLLRDLGLNGWPHENRHAGCRSSWLHANMQRAHLVTLHVGPSADTRQRTRFYRLP